MVLGLEGSIIHLEGGASGTLSEESQSLPVWRQILTLDVNKEAKSLGASRELGYSGT